MDLRKEVINYMRSCLNSNKEKLSVRQLNIDYKTLIGEWIPYQKLGYKKLEDLIQSEQNEFTLTKIGQEYYVTATQNDKSAHIREMVAKQKTSKKKPPRVRFHRPSAAPRMQQMSKWRPKFNSPSKYQGSQRPQAVRHAQFVTRGAPVTNRAPSVPSKVVIPVHSSYNNKPQHNVPAPPAAARVDMNQRLTSNRVKKNMDALDRNGITNGQAVTNSIMPNPVGAALNPLMSTKKRILRMMSEINLERDSGNSSPTGEILPPAGEILPPSSDIFPPTPSPSLSSTPSPTICNFIRTGNPLQDLKSFAEMHKLGEVKVDEVQINPKRKKFYSCKIKVGTKYTYSSYPNEFLNPLEARNFCCEEALTDLIPKFRRKSLMIASETDILDRIPPLLEKHPFGIWAWQLKDDYSDKYNELLSDDWLKIVDVSPCVQIEKISDDFVLRHCRPGDKGQRTAMAVPLANVSVPANTVRSGEDGRLNAQVTCVMSASEIWCQQTATEESEIYANMMDRLQIYYQEHEHKLIPTNISIAGYYIAKYDGGYYRVRAVKVNALEVDCFFIDWGDELTIPKSDIFELKREYATAQAQAFVCRLYGLEELYEVSNNSQSLNSLYEKPVVIEIALDVSNNEGLNEALPVFMYDFDTGQSINQELIPKLTMELASPILQKDGITEVYVSNIESNGDVYVQLRTLGYENWLKLKLQMEEQINENPPNNTLYQVTRANSREKLYFFKQISSGSWSRVKLIDWSPAGDLAQIYFVDDGHTDVIKVADEKLYPLEALNDIFNNYPYQAVRVKMELEQIPPNFVDLVSSVMPTDQPVLLKIMGTTEDDFPLVKLFRRNVDGGLFCINTSISLEAEIKKEENNNLGKGKFKLGQFAGSECVPSTGALKCPTLPEIGNSEYFEVFIPVAVSPYNFFIQPLESKQELDEMMERLQDRYRNIQYGSLKTEDVLPGTIYASKHDDGFWYRTSVIKVIHSGSVSVFYCDFGYYQTLPVKHLVPLDKEFMELPYQALKAKLADVKPTQSKWTMNDCEQFKDLIEKKSFFSLLLNIEKDILYESDLVLKVLLIDTSSEEDVYIGKELVRRGLAVDEE